MGAEEIKSLERGGQTNFPVQPSPEFLVEPFLCWKLKRDGDAGFTSGVPSPLICALDPAMPNRANRPSLLLLRHERASDRAQSEVGIGQRHQ